MRFSDAGMTILELVIASAITLIIGLSVFGAVYSGRSAWQSGRAVVEAHRNASAALDVMQREISSMFIFPPAITLDDTGLFYGDNGNGVREFRFYALITRHSGEWDLCRVGYRYNEDAREIQRLFNVDLHEGKQMAWQPLAGGVNSLEFFLYSGEGDDSSVYDYWDTFSDDSRQRGKIPERVGIIIEVQDDRGLAEEKKFELLVSVPAGRKKVFIPE